MQDMRASTRRDVLDGVCFFFRLGFVRRHCSTGQLGRGEVPIAKLIHGGIEGLGTPSLFLFRDIVLQHISFEVDLGGQHAADKDGIPQSLAPFPNHHRPSYRPRSGHVPLVLSTLSSTRVLWQQRNVI